MKGMREALEGLTPLNQQQREAKAIIEAEWKQLTEAHDRTVAGWQALLSRYDDLVKTANIVVARYAEATHSSGDLARLEDALNALSEGSESKGRSD